MDKVLTAPIPRKLSDDFSLEYLEVPGIAADSEVFFSRDDSDIIYTCRNVCPTT